MCDQSEFEHNEWEIELNWLQRSFHQLSSVIIFCMSIGVGGYLLILLAATPSLFYLYIPALVMTFYFQRSFFKKQSYEKKTDQEKCLLRIDDANLYYGVTGRELVIGYPVIFKKGLFGCVNIVFGPGGYCLPILIQTAKDPLLKEALQKAGLLDNTQP